MVNKISDLLKSRFDTFLLLFILFQPLLDLFTSLSIFLLKQDLTLGILIRFAIMLLGLLYLLTVDDKKTKLQVLSYLGILFVFFAISLANNFLVKEPMSIFAEGKNIAKLVYMTILLFSYYYAFRALRKKAANWDIKLQNYITYSMIVIGAVMIIASLTGTGIKSYESIKKGHQGWFFAGNELGAIMAICLPVVVYYALRNTKSWKTSYYWIPVVMIMFSLLALGTKVGWGAIAIVLAVSLGMSIIELFWKKQKHLKYSIVINAVLLAIFFSISQYTPVYFNTNVHLGWVGVDKEKIEENEVAIDDISEEGMTNIMLSGREKFLAMHKEYYAEAPTSQKLLGMGYAGNYEEEAKVVERDFHDLFYSFGSIGFVLFLLPYVVIALWLLVTFLRHFLELFNTKNILIGSGVVLALGIAYTAGHIFFAPAASIYLAIMIAYLMNNFAEAREI
ncbi:O-antigen ligase family protein [Bacillus sp. HMF5848]|uniref:O-antigen ligase family protein n=1 Tax=Bacillus sp. HMF5848 TaxID=2495421 RepID=UPI0021ADFE74|nr:O-antigen ligase family protein [Bacillus sp. HMF5848]